MSSSLRIPRVEVFWGDYNLTYYSGGDVSPSDPLFSQPLVYNVSCNLTESGQTPTGSMNWNPSGAAYKVYEKLVTKHSNRIITVRYYYLDGRSISFAFVWAGQEESYGNSMDIRVVMSSELDGLINGSIKSTSQVDEQGVSMSAAVTELQQSFGIEKYKIIDYATQAKVDLDKVKVQTNYSMGQKFQEAVSGLVEKNGNMVFLTNIISTTDTSQPAAKCIFYTPYIWDKDTPVQELSPTEQFPDPKVRYGYFLGPCMIDTIVKNSQWQPSQKRQTLSPNVTQQIQPTETPTQGVTTTNVQPQQAVAANAVATSTTSGSAGIANATSRPQARLAENEDGEKKNELKQEEHQCRLTATLFMCPAVTGIKPYDIIFIPNYSGTFMEDWIVTSTEYSQSDGGVNISVQAARKFALGEFMNPSQGKVWQEKAKSYGLAGDNPTLENWMNYAWKPGMGGATSNTSVSGGTSNPFANATTDGREITQVSGFTAGVNESLA